MLSEVQVAEVKEVAPDANVVRTRDENQIEAILHDLEVVAGWVPRELVLKAPGLRWMQQWWSGADWVLSTPDAKRDFVLTNMSGVHPIQMSEHILGLMLAFSRQLHNAIRAQSRNEWRRVPGETLSELAGKTILLVGVGAIGQRTAQVASAFGMRVLGIRRSPSKSVPHVEKMLPPDQLLSILPEADFVVIAAPLTPETRGMIGQAALQRMKKTAYLINIGRGEIVDQACLVQVLQKGGIAGAGLDVFEKEPLPKESPLWQMENVIITAHYAGASQGYHQRAFAIFIDNLRRYQAGEPLRNVVNKELGY
ncbi:MAG: D-2-hydroxyacid dehydrogenase [Ardenticatenaceae bacterium]